jgi:uncharacterized protein (TIGR02270 family)
MGIIPSVVLQHAEESAFLWLIRDASVRSPHYKPHERKRLDNRVEAHLDGLRVAGDAGWDIACKQAEEHPEPGELFAVGVLAFESGDPKRIEQVLTLAVKKPELGPAVASALGWLPEAMAPSRLAPLVAHGSPKIRRIGLAGYAIRRLNPGTALEKALNDTDLDLRSRALKMVGEMGYVAWLPLLKKHLAINHLPCRFYAAWSAGALADDQGTITELQSIALTESGYRQRAAGVVVRRLEVAAAQRWLNMLASLPGSERIAIHGMGALGDSASIPRLLEWMKQPPLARVAVEAFTFITGAHLADLDLDGNRPEGFEAGPNEDALDENVSMDPDDGLPWPDVAKVSRWWSANQGRFPKGVRHLCGKPITMEWLQEVVLKERQRLRTAAALELLIRNPKQPMIETRSRQC